MERRVDVECFTWKQEITFCSLVLLIALLQNAGILTGLVISLTVLFKSRKRIMLVQGLLSLSS